MKQTWIMTAAKTLTMTRSSGLCIPPLRVEARLGVDRDRLEVAAPNTALDPLEEVLGRVVTYYLHN
jgi:hypothetical protein